VNQTLAARLRAGDILCGTILSLGSPEVADLLGGAGFDWLFVDAEHGTLEPRDVLLILQAVGSRTPCLVRIPELDEGWVKHVLDAGADGIIIPQVGTAAQAERAVRLAHYPPRGTRGLGTARVNRYGLALTEHLRTAADRLLVVVQAETEEAVRNIDAIAAVPGLGAVFVGPYDLSASLGHPGLVDHPDVALAIGRVASACAKAGIPTGIFAAGAAGLKTRVGEGFTLLAAGVDATLLGEAAGSLLGDLHGLARSRASGTSPFP
jgi:2-dehydro-3-deoxyglucarate aldolase/4-hydroxy-2-oxoheptanedioate aldolase